MGADGHGWGLCVAAGGPELSDEDPTGLRALGYIR